MHLRETELKSMKLDSTAVWTHFPQSIPLQILIYIFFYPFVRFPSQMKFNGKWAKWAEKKILHDTVEFHLNSWQRRSPVSWDLWRENRNRTANAVPVRVLRLPSFPMKSGDECRRWDVIKLALCWKKSFRFGTNDLSRHSIVWKSKQNSFKSTCSFKCVFFSPTPPSSPFRLPRTCLRY